MNAETQCSSYKYSEQEIVWPVDPEPRVQKNIPWPYYVKLSPQDPFNLTTEHGQEFFDPSSSDSTQSKNEEPEWHEIASIILECAIENATKRLRGLSIEPYEIFDVENFDETVIEFLKQSVSPFNLVDENRRQEDKVKHLIFHLKANLKASYRNELAERIKVLFEESLEFLRKPFSFCLHVKFGKMFSTSFISFHSLPFGI